MKKPLIILFFFWMCFLHIVSQSTSNHTIRQEIRYKCKDAKEVFFVWGVNNWQLDESIKASGTFKKDKMFHTPMQPKNGYFTITLEVKPNTNIDYVFWITKGPASYTTNIWDLNAPQKDYHTLAVQENITTIDSGLKIRPTETISLLDFAKPLSINLLVLMAFLFMLKRNILHNKQKAGPLLIVIASALVLFFMLVSLRQSITGNSWDLYLDPFNHLGDYFVSGFYDATFVLAITISYLVLLYIFRRSYRTQFIIAFSFAGLCLLALVMGILNIRIVEALGRPFNMQWLYYSDFLKSSDAKYTIVSNMSSDYLENIALLVITGICSAIVTVLLSEILFIRHRSKKIAMILVGCLFLFYLGISGWMIRSKNWNYDKLSNPFIAFTESLDFFTEQPELFTMSVPDSLKFKIRKERRSVISSNFTIKNVLLFVMESTPAEYLQAYGSDYKITPELEKYSASAIQFENIYAHAPATNLSMVSLLGSIYPWLSCYTLTNEHPDLIFPTLSSELKKHGYRTSFFNSADNRFQNSDKFLAHRNFDFITDCQGNYCNEHFFHPKENWHFPDGKDDECTADQLANWIHSEKEQPFFTVMWTYQTHYPYFLSGRQKKHVSNDTMFNRYLNALEHSDRVFGKLMKNLEDEGLLNSTLVVVVGDHGEAFGRHNQTTHAQKVYEENLHVPCLFINPSFSKAKSKVVGGLVDIAPTIMNVLNYDSPDNWQGENLFSDNKTDRVYFFAPWSDYLFGYRDGKHKFIFNVTKSTTEIYDLTNDPEEKNNIASRFRDKMPLYTHRMAAWVQYHNQFMEKLLKK